MCLCDRHVVMRILRGLVVFAFLFVQNALVLLSVKSGKELLRKQFDSQASSRKVSLVKQVMVLDSSHIVCTVGTDVKVVTIPARYAKLD